MRYFRRLCRARALKFQEAIVWNAQSRKVITSLWFVKENIFKFNLMLLLITLWDELELAGYPNSSLSTQRQDDQRPLGPTGSTPDLQCSVLLSLKGRTFASDRILPSPPGLFKADSSQPYLRGPHDLYPWCFLDYTLHPTPMLSPSFWEPRPAALQVKLMTLQEAER